jgi:hypothetical protein
MRAMISVLKQAIRQSVLILSLVAFIFTSGFFLVEQPSLADSESPLATEESFSKINAKPASREAAYEEAVKAANDPKGLEKEFEKGMENYKEEHPGENPVVEGAKELVEKVTGKE